MIPELKKITIEDYIYELKSKKAVPGGGAAAAFSGAQGIALIIMVINFTIGKKKYEKYEELCISMRNKSEILLDKLISGIDDDKNAYFKVRKAFAMPNNTLEEKEKRKKAVSKASETAALVPLTVMNEAFEGMQISEAILGKTNINLESDIRTGVFNLYTCVNSAFENVKANLYYIDDKKEAESIKFKAVEIVENSHGILSKVCNCNE